MMIFLCNLWLHDDNYILYNIGIPPGDKNWQLSQRQQAIERSQTRTEEEHTAKAEAKRELDRFGVRSQMTVCVIQI